MGVDASPYDLGHVCSLTHWELMICVMTLITIVFIIKTVVKTLSIIVQLQIHCSATRDGFLDKVYGQNGIILA